MIRSEKILCSIYAIIAFVALIATWSNNLAFIREPENQNVVSFYRALYANPAAASFTNDLLLYALAGFIFMALEARRLHIRFVWAHILLSLFIAVSVMFHLFLIARQIAISQHRAQPSTLDNSILTGAPH
jgi:Ca2+/Na+ antiporter